MKYAMHVGLHDYDTTDPQQTREVIAELSERVDRAIRGDNLPIKDFAIHADGDSFIEWGEPYRDTPFEVDVPHGMVFFDAPSHKVAWAYALAIFRDLLLDPNPVIRLGATCDPSLDWSPMAVTSSEVWSSQIAINGEIKGDIFPA